MDIEKWVIEVPEWLTPKTFNPQSVAHRLAITKAFTQAQPGKKTEAEFVMGQYEFATGEELDKCLQKIWAKKGRAVISISPAPEK